jgi:hypothetical protein
MSDTSVTIEAPTTPTPPPTLDPSIPQRDPQGNLLEPGQKPPLTTPPTEAKTEPKAGDPPAKTSTSEGAPEKYEDFTAPDGYTIDPKTIEAAAPIFKDLGLTQAQAQSLVDFHTKQMIDAAKAPQTTYETMRNEWQTKAKADPDMSKHAVDGKTGLDAVKVDMGRALTALNDPALAADFKAAMDLTGAGDHPAFIKTFWKLAQFVTEGKAVTPGGPSVHGQTPPGNSGRPDAARALYPNLS